MLLVLSPFLPSSLLSWDLNLLTRPAIKNMKWSPFIKGTYQSYTWAGTQMKGSTTARCGALPSSLSSQYPVVLMSALPRPIEHPTSCAISHYKRGQKGERRAWQSHPSPQNMTSLRGPAGKRIRHHGEFPSCGCYYQ